jgi:hypothetical protein
MFASMRSPLKAANSPSSDLANRATIMESSSTYFMDDGALTRHMCEQESESLDEQPEILNECCACDEAKFEMIFEGQSLYAFELQLPNSPTETL